MPLLCLSVNTGLSLLETVAFGMERDGGFTLVHNFGADFNNDVEFTLKHVYVNVSGAGRFTALEERGENKEPTIWLDVVFPDMEEEIISSKRNDDTTEYKTLSNGREIFPRSPPLKFEMGVMRFPITCFPINGYRGTTSSSANSNKLGRQSNNAQGATLESRGVHICDIPLGKMKLQDNCLRIRFNPRDQLLENMIRSTGGLRKVRIRSMSVLLEYK